MCVFGHIIVIVLCVHIYGTLSLSANDVRTLCSDDGLADERAVKLCDALQTYVQNGEHGTLSMKIILYICFCTLSAMEWVLLLRK